MACRGYHAHGIWVYYRLEPNGPGERQLGQSRGSICIASIRDSRYAVRGVRSHLKHRCWSCSWFVGTVVYVNEALFGFGTWRSGCPCTGCYLDCNATIRTCKCGGGQIVWCTHVDILRCTCMSVCEGSMAPAGSTTAAVAAEWRLWQPTPVPWWPGTLGFGRDGLQRLAAAGASRYM